MRFTSNISPMDYTYIKSRRKIKESKYKIFDELLYLLTDIKDIN